MAIALLLHLKYIQIRLRDFDLPKTEEAKQGSNLLFCRNKKQKLSDITSDEAILMKEINKKWKDKKTAEIVNFTHNQLPYLMADDEEIVSYALITQEDPHEVY